MTWDEFLEGFLCQLRQNYQIELDQTDEQILRILFPTERWAGVTQNKVCEKLAEVNQADNSINSLGVDGVQKRLGIIYLLFDQNASVGLEGKQNKAKILHSWLISKFQEQQNPPSKSDNTSENLARLLLSLDYQRQEGDFTQIRQQLDYFGVFVFGSTAYRTQLWLVSRLARQFPGYQDAIKIPIKVNKHLMQNDFSQFLEEISIKTNLSLPADNDDECINILYENYKSISLIIGLYGVQKLSESVSQRFLNFWQKFCNKMQSEKTYNLDNLGIFIFMSHDVDSSVCALETSLSAIFDNNNFVYKLANIPIISLEDTTGWLKEKARNKELEKQKVQRIIDDRLPGFNHGNTDALFDDICGALEEEIESVAKYWELSK